MDGQLGFATLDYACKKKRTKRDVFLAEMADFGMKAHVGVDASSGLVHSAGVTSGNVHDAKLMDRLIRDDDTAVYGDKGYASDAKKRAAEAAGVLWAVKEKAKPGGRLAARAVSPASRFFPASRKSFDQR